MAARNSQALGESKLNGQVIIGELVRNMELGQFEMNYSVLLPCIFSLYLHPDDYARLSGVMDLIVEDAKRALCARVAQLNAKPPLMSLRRSGKPREYKIASADWVIEFFPDTEGAVPAGDVEVHSDLNETAQPGFRGTKTTLMDRDPSVTAQWASPPARPRRAGRAEKVAAWAEIRYEDDTGPQVFLVTQNLVRIGRGGMPIWRWMWRSTPTTKRRASTSRCAADAATGQFLICRQKHQRHLG